MCLRNGILAENGIEPLLRSDSMNGIIRTVGELPYDVMRREAVAEPVAIVVIILVRYSADSTCDCDSLSSLVMFFNFVFHCS